MTSCSRAALFAAVSILWCGGSAFAETMRCQSVNGNLNCAGSSGVSCQTVNGKTVCISGHGGVVQSFGGQSLGNQSLGETNPPAGDPGVSDDTDDAPPPAKQRIEQRNLSGHSMLLEQDGRKLHFRNDWVSIDRD